MIFKRSKNRNISSVRDVELIIGYSKFSHGSCFMKLGNTHVLCTANLEEKVPRFIKGTGKGWLSAEYGMLPGATHIRTNREASKGMQSGRTQEIQRLIGRSLRLALDFEILGERQIIIDCDVIQADGGTRTASITCGYVALHQAIDNLLKRRILRKNPLVRQIAAISCGIVHDEIYLDLEYIEDSIAEVDANLVLDSKGSVIEFQLSSETKPIAEERLLQIISISRAGIEQLIKKQNEALGI